MLTSISKVVVGFLWFVYMITYINNDGLPSNSFEAILGIATMPLAWRLVRTGYCDICRTCISRIKRSWRKLRNKEVKSEE